MSGIEIDRLEDLADFREIEADWDGLSFRDGPVPLPLSAPWISSWWRSFGNDDHMAIYVGRDSKGVACALPMRRAIGKYRGVRVEIASTLTNEYSPYSGLLVRRDLSRSMVLCFLKKVIAGSDVDVFRLSGIGRDDPLYCLLQTTASELNRPYGLGEGLVTPIVSTTEEWDEYLSGRSKKFRKGMREKRNKFFRNGLSVEQHYFSGGQDSVLDEIIDISARSWKRKLRTDLSSSLRSRNFLRNLAESFRDSCFVWIARDGDVPVAFEFHIEHQNSTYPIRADFAEEYGKLSPGSVVEYAAMENAFRQDSVSLYYTCADDYEYLRRWTDTYVQYFIVEIFRSSLKSLFLFGLEYRAMPLYRRLRSQF